jgi:L-ascorbate metabolism protein UlaG (beta-lactamase superfamily)
MDLTYLGHSCFKISGKKISILTDPFSSSMVGIPLAKQEADVVTVSHDHADHNFLEAVKGEYLLFDAPGEYEYKETEFQGVAASHGNDRGKITIFTMEVDDIKLCHLGDLGEDLNNDQLDKIDGVDVLMIPVGGEYTIDAKQAVKVISQIEPKIVIPMHYKVGKMDKLAPLTTFLHEIGAEPKPQDKLKITAKDLPEEIEVVVLKTQ